VREWYDLCDSTGLYIICEANIESHGMGYGKETLAKAPRVRSHLDRTVRMVEVLKNHPCIMMWSLGNEPQRPELRAHLRLDQAAGSSRPSTTSGRTRAQHRRVLSDVRDDRAMTNYARRIRRGR
jgi:beta-galactosidase